jgi:plasmid replication initiation protein
MAFSNKENLVVVKSNQVITASYKLTMNEQRIVLACIAKIDCMKELTKDDGVTIRVDEIKDLLQIDDKSNNSFYGAMKSAADKLYERSILLDDEGSRRRWVYEVNYNKHKGDITLYFSPTIIPYLTELKGNFTKYKLEHISKFRSVHSIRIYELLCQYGFIGERELELEELKAILGLEDKYARPSNFISRVIDVAVDEINKYSNIKVAYGIRKTGKRITHIQLSFDMKNYRESKTITTIDDFVRANKKLTKGKSEWEVKKLMQRSKH